MTFFFFFHSTLTFSQLQHPLSCLFMCSSNMPFVDSLCSEAACPSGPQRSDHRSKHYKHQPFSHRITVLALWLHPHMQTLQKTGLLRLCSLMTCVFQFYFGSPLNQQDYCFTGPVVLERGCLIPRKPLTDITHMFCCGEYIDAAERKKCLFLS